MSVNRSILKKSRHIGIGLLQLIPLRLQPSRLQEMHLFFILLAISAFLYQDPDHPDTPTQLNYDFNQDMDPTLLKHYLSAC